MMQIASDPVLGKNLVIPHCSYTTENVPPDERISAWKLTIDVLFDVVATKAPFFSASLTVYHFNRFLLCAGHLDSARYRRDSARIRRCDLDHYLLHLPLHRSVVFGKRLRVRPRDIVFLDISQPTDFRMAAGTGLSILIPRTALSSRLYDPVQLHGLILRQECVSCQLLTRLLSSFAAAAHRLTVADVLKFSSPVLDMVGACLAKAVAGKSFLLRGVQSDIGRRARHHVELHLCRADLTPATLAKEIGTSRSQLYRAFERFGGVHQYIVDRRLRRCFYALCDPGKADCRIGMLAYEYGFADEAHFSRLFRKTFGVSPSAARQTLQHSDALAFFGVAQQPIGPSVFAHWIRELTSV